MANRCFTPAIQTLRGVRGKKIAMIFQGADGVVNPLHTLEKQLYEVLSLLTAGCVGKRLCGEVSVASSRCIRRGKTADRLSASALRGNASG